ncbi:hypothetical protein [Bradyrhizobium sp. DOA1]|uniref:hypothetical protein n=1 Tax=Bradyrhizobium sp. DOA1 TaxID=1126616 RepID=UPI0018D332DA|nr:hypothetical protein [Bradyrhizobium sp. DOA1]
MKHWLICRKTESKAIQTTPPQDLDRPPFLPVPQSSRIRRDLSRGRGAAVLNAVEQSSSFSPSSSGAPQCRHMRADNDGALPLVTA